MKWNVEVLMGPPVTPEDGAPVTFGSPNVLVADDGSMSDPSVNLIYEGVGLRYARGEAWLWVPRPEDGSPSNFRFMWHVKDLEIEWGNSIRLEGMEVNSEGVLVPAAWEATYRFPTEEEIAEHHRILGMLDGEGDDGVGM